MSCSIVTGIRIRGALDCERDDAKIANTTPPITVSSTPNSVDVTQDGTKSTYTFDFVLGPQATQQDVFKQVGVPTLNDVFNGFNATVMCYGQTGAGKSYTLLGPNGLVHNFAKELFARIAQKTAESKSLKYKVELTMTELHMEVVFDLLADNRQVSVQR